MDILTTSLEHIESIHFRLRRSGLDANNRPIWYAENVTEAVTVLVRATDRGSAIEKIRLQYPNATFSR